MQVQSLITLTEIGERNVASPSRKFSTIFSAIAVVGLSAGLAACSPTSDSASSASDARVSTPVILSDGTFKVCASFGTPPNIYVDDSGEPVGAEVDIARALAGNLGLTAEFAEYNFSGLVPALQAKQCDVIMASLYIKPEREEVANFVPYLRSGSAVLVADGNPAGVTGFDDSLCGKKLIAITGASGAVHAEEKSAECVADGKDPINITLNDNITSLQQVLTGQADAFLDTAELAGYYEKLGDFEVVGEPFGEITIGAATLKANTDLHDSLQTAFSEIVDSGEYSEILEEWGLSGQDINA